MSKNQPRLKVATYNANCQVTNTFHLTNIVTYCHNQNINVLLLQEVGLKIPTLPPNQFPLNQFHYICETPTNKNHPISQTTSIMINKKLLPTLSKVSCHPNGRYTSIILNLPDKGHIRITSLYCINRGFQHFYLQHGRCNGIQGIFASLPPHTQTHGLVGNLRMKDTFFRKIWSSEFECRTDIGMSSDQTFQLSKVEQTYRANFSKEGFKIHSPTWKLQIFQTIQIFVMTFSTRWNSWLFQWSVDGPCWIQCTLFGASPPLEQKKMLRGNAHIDQIHFP